MLICEYGINRIIDTNGGDAINTLHKTQAKQYIKGL